MSHEIASRIVEKSPFLTTLVKEGLLDPSGEFLPKRSLDELRCSPCPSCAYRFKRVNCDEVKAWEVGYHGNCTGHHVAKILREGLRQGAKPGAYGHGIYLTPSFRYCLLYYGFPEQLADGSTLVHSLEVRCREQREHPVFPPSWQQDDVGVEKHRMEWVVADSCNAGITAVITKELRGRTKQEWISAG
eukprot:CAMPEP_0197674492 /NCGR_PEP_ID=MMETSP1338-20131121/83078_1 /TAXON_ID=43686 ORGANISM="Pelagodinium beii, Strain RCC1491" /NCGR_SAMPLE_ID=MMETSP1338 /ASSEMBLY_ACC=CAM_ASM_000754 /LENGTH=187 /DNA_ID=CAMNT_0043254907 /DNA_START=104 /DNA_END=663 /DNA_ORIENTATION=+